MATAMLTDFAVDLDPASVAGAPCRVPPLVPRREHFNGPERLSPAWGIEEGIVCRI
jgi:hypothetical protein